MGDGLGAYPSCMKVLHIPGLKNRGNDLISRCRSFSKVPLKNPMVVEQFQNQLGNKEVSLFVVQNDTHCLI